MKIMNLLILTGAMLLVSCASNSPKDISKRHPAATRSAKIQKAINRVEDHCRIGNRVTRQMKLNARRPTYIRGNGQKLQNFILDNGKVVIIDLNNCDIKTFSLHGDKVVDSRSASGQLYFRTAAGRLHVLIPNKDMFYEDNSFNIYEVGRVKQGNKRYRFSPKHHFHGMKATSKGKQGIHAWSHPSCSQNEVEKSPKNRLKICQNDSTRGGRLTIRGKAKNSRQSLYRIYDYSKRQSRPRTRQIFYKSGPVKPIQCETVSVELKFLFIFSVSETVTTCS